MRLNHNLASLNIYREHERVLQRQSGVLERIASGNKISSAKDDPVKLADSERMRIQIRGLQMAERNAQDGISMLQTADGGLDGMTSMLQRIRELTLQAGSGANNTEDKETIQTEINSLIEGMEDISKNTEFNGIRLLNGNETDKSLFMSIGANVGEKVDIPMFDLSCEKIGNGSKTLKDLSTLGVEGLGVDSSLSIIDGALDSVLSARSKYGAICNRFESSHNKLNEIYTCMQGSESKIRDSDVAEEMVGFARDNILIEAGNAMMAQSNKFPQDALRVLENVRTR
ncbi:flagellin [Clostridium sp. MB40-C1]|uniref:flagellin N-terminal helical domain-containing protein n=1 Tax=Clostridium sp. MB40-C1 TaxID=3070996 RepID=UPI0027E074F9|nr:flagellin [Clostridium sp. MB40-C1]WMJ81330.1 flagellin [Clostridium sp. MB40-C1]